VLRSQDKVIASGAGISADDAIASVIERGQARVLDKRP
jgi:hypothetical protein